MNLQNVCISQQNNTYMQPLTYFSYSQQNALPFCPTMWHEELFIAKVSRGNGKIITDGVTHYLNGGDIVVLPPFTLYTLTSQNNLELHCCMANLRTLQNNKNNITYLSSANMDCVVTVDDEKYPQICQALVQLHQDRHHEHMLLIDIQNILHWLHHKTAENNITTDKHLFTIKNALNLLHHANQQIVVKDLAEQCGYSEFYLMKLFKKFTGFACIDYAINFKLTQIAWEICTTNEDFCKIAQKYGFSNVSYFNRQFKKLFTLTPKQFKKAFAC